MPGEKQSEYVVLNKPFKGGPLGFLNTSNTAAGAPSEAASSKAP